MSFTVWQSKDTVYIIDGHHRYKVLDLLEKEGVNVPKKLPCTFIECKDKKEASKLVLTYSSIYAKVQEEGLYEFLNINEFDFESIKNEIDIPEIDFEKFELGYFKEQDEEKLNDVPALQEKAISKLGDLFLIDGKHRVLCGDSTKEESYKVLFEGKKADMIFTDPPYKFESNGGGALHKQYEKTAERIKKIVDFEPKPFLNNLNLAFSDGSMNAYIFCNKDLVIDYLNFARDNGYSYNILVWKKPNCVPFGDSHRPDIEYIILLRKNAVFNNGLQNVNYSRFLEYGKQNDLHPTMKPVELIKDEILISSRKNKIVVDLYLGSGSTLIACEQTNRICYGIELDEHYIDVILRRYKKLYPDAKFECLNRKFDFKELFKAVS